MTDKVTLSQRPAIVTLDDIFVIMLTENIKDGKTRANYQVLKEFFEELRNDPKDWATAQVRDVLNNVWPDDVDHMMTRVFGLSVGCSFKTETGDDSCYMDEQRVLEASKYYHSLSNEDRLALDVIAYRYGVRLMGASRCPMNRDLIDPTDPDDAK